MLDMYNFFSSQNINNSRVNINKTKIILNKMLARIVPLHQLNTNGHISDKSPFVKEVTSTIHILHIDISIFFI